jgi:cyclic beta-1,2-glucan synthetase
VGEGSYTGKGIYDVDAFEAALAGRVPENALLSHDLFEGVFARAGLVTDVELFESAPSHYGVRRGAQHRWARGDWQLLPWILGRRVPVIGRWKMLDNLRARCRRPATFLTLVVAWLTAGDVARDLERLRPRHHRRARTPAGLGGVIPRRRGISKRSHRARGRPRPRAGRLAGRAHAHDAGVPGLADDRRDRADARACVRDAPQPAGMGDGGAGQGGLRLDLSGFYRRMAGSPALAAAVAIAVAWARPEAWPAALPFLLLWAAAPAVARWISLPRTIATTEPLIWPTRARSG